MIYLNISVNEDEAFENAGWLREVYVQTSKKKHEKTMDSYLA